MTKLMPFYMACLLLFLPLTAQAETSKTIHIVSQSWENYASKDCAGYMWDLIAAVFHQEGYTLKCSIAPYLRGVEMVKRHHADAWLASYKDEQKFAIYPKWPHDFERTGVAATKDTMKGWTLTQGLFKKKVAFVRGYELDNYIDDDFEKIEVNKLQQALDMVIAGRSDFAADDSDDIKDFFEKHPRYAEMLEVRQLFSLALYLAFSDSMRSRKLIEIWDKHLPTLLEQGAIKAIYEKAGKEGMYSEYWEDYTRP